MSANCLLSSACSCCRSSSATICCWSRSCCSTPVPTRPCPSSSRTSCLQQWCVTNQPLGEGRLQDEGCPSPFLLSLGSRLGLCCDLSALLSVLWPAGDRCERDAGAVLRGNLPLSHLHGPEAAGARLRHVQARMVRVCLGRSHRPTSGLSVLLTLVLCLAEAG